MKRLGYTRFVGLAGAVALVEPGRALQPPALKAWVGRPENVDAGQRAYLHRAKMNSAARTGKYSLEMEQSSVGVTGPGRDARVNLRAASSSPGRCQRLFAAQLRCCGSPRRVPVVAHPAVTTRLPHLANQ